MPPPTIVPIAILAIRERPLVAGAACDVTLGLRIGFSVYAIDSAAIIIIVFMNSSGLDTQSFVFSCEEINEDS